jgi:hypothetical protein
LYQRTATHGGQDEVPASDADMPRHLMEAKGVTQAQRRITTSVFTGNGFHAKTVQYHWCGLPPD